MSNLFKALMPAHAEIAEQLNGKPVAKLPTSGTAVSAFAAKLEGAGRPLDDDVILSCLRGHPELVNIAQFDRELALSLKALVDVCEEADFWRALELSMAVTKRLRTLHLQTACDQEGVRQ